MLQQIQMKARMMWVVLFTVAAGDDLMCAIILGKFYM